MLEKQKEGKKKTDNENDEVFEFNAETRKIISNLWSKVKIAASNVNN